MTDFTDVGISQELKLQSADVQVLENEDIVKGIWWFEDGKWAPQGISRGPVYAMFRKGTDQNPQGYLNLFEIISSYTNGPLLVTDQGFVVKKDIAAGGYISANQGELWLGSGRDDQLDVPKIVLFQSETSRVFGGGPLSVPGLPMLSGLPAKVYGKLVMLSVAYGGNPPGMIYRCYGNEPTGKWVAQGHFTEFPGNFDTLYITKGDSETPAHLDVGNLTAH
jgi:hypothetical protein